MRCLVIEPSEEGRGELVAALLRRQGLEVGRGVRRPELVVVVGGDEAAWDRIRREGHAEIPMLGIGCGVEPESATLDGWLSEPITGLRLADAVRVVTTPAKRALRARLATAEAERDWVRSLVHDLNGPLTVISGMLQLAQLGPLSRRQAESLEHARNAEGRLRRHVRDLLSSFAPHGMHAERHPQSVATVLEAAAVALRPAAEQRGVRLVVDCPRTLAAEVDADLLERALVNLGENALRYAPQGTAVRLWAVDDGTGARIAVSDEGPGVPEAQRETLFEPFRQGDDPRGGGIAGLGLSCVRMVADAHGGRAWVEDAPRGGACFVIEIPAPGLPLCATG